MKGVYTALATPFRADGEIDFSSLNRIMEQQFRAGIRGFVVAGTTAESPTLSRMEKEKLFRFVFDFSRGKEIDLVAGTGTNDTRESIALTQMAGSIGYSRFLVVVPYYNKPSPAGLVRHFETIADACRGEVVLYNVPGRTVISLSVDTIVELSAHPKIRALKEASGNLDFFREIQSALKAKGRSLSLLSGDDPTYYSFLLAGGKGTVSVASHVCPTAMIEIDEAVRAGDGSRGEALQKKFSPLFRDLFVESNPGPLKWMLSRLGLCEDQLRLPLVSIQESSRARLETLLQDFRVENGEFR